jgi:acyl-CoA thioesterase
VGFSGDTGVTAKGYGKFEAQIHPAWCIGTTPNGGYLLAIALRALQESLPFGDPIAVSSHFFAAPRVGIADITVEILRVGKTLMRAQGRLMQGEVEVLRVVAAFGQLDNGVGLPTFVDTGQPPSIPLPDHCQRVNATTPDGRASPVRDQFEIRYHPDSVGWASGAPSGTAEVKAWIRLVDKSPPDGLLIPLLLDVLPASVFDVGVMGWVPTIEMTVYQRARPRGAWLLCSIQCRFAAGGMMVENGEVWDEDHRLIATSYQLALLPRELG